LNPKAPCTGRYLPFQTRENSHLQPALDRLAAPLRRRSANLRPMGTGDVCTMRLTILTTGGTIDKTYDELQGGLRNSRSVLDVILGSLRLPDLFIRHVEVLHKDSLDMGDEDRQAIVKAVRDALPSSDAVVVLHGTDTLSKTGEFLHSQLGEIDVPVILTGAMRPYELRDTDALQNLTEALLAVRLLGPGVFVVMHNKILRFPGVIKDHDAGTFVGGLPPGLAD